jgi:hypothetical protein
MRKEVAVGTTQGLRKSAKDLRIVGVLAEIRREHLQNTNVECCRYTNPLL